MKIRYTISRCPVYDEQLYLYFTTLHLSSLEGDSKGSKTTIHNRYRAIFKLFVRDLDDSIQYSTNQSPGYNAGGEGIVVYT